MVKNGFFVNTDRKLFAIANGSMYQLETEEGDVSAEPGYYNENGDRIGGSFVDDD